MTIHKHHLRQTNKSMHWFRDPAEEEDLAHIHMTLRYALTVFGIVPFVTIAIGIWISAHPHYPVPVQYPNTTEYIRANYHYNETGNGHIWVWMKNKTSGEQYKWNLGTYWAPLFTQNKSHYIFGIGDHNFCEPRKNETIEHTWSTSIYRATQLYASVQTTVRYGILFVFLPMVFNSYIISKTLVMETKTISSLFIGVAYFCNEVVLYITYFALTTLHVTAEQDYIPYSNIYLSLAIILSTTKLILRNFTETLGISTTIRSIGILVLIISHDPLTTSAQEFIDHVYCDTFVSPKICTLELLCIMIIFLNNLYDVHYGKLYLLVVSQTADDVNIQEIAETSVFRRMKSQ